MEYSVRLSESVTPREKVRGGEMEERQTVCVRSLADFTNSLKLEKAHNGKTTCLDDVNCPANFRDHFGNSRQYFFTWEYTAR